MYVAKKNGLRRPLFFGDRVVSCFTTAEASIYAHNKRKIVIQSCFCTVVIGDFKFVFHCCMKNKNKHQYEERCVHLVEKILKKHGETRGGPFKAH